MKKSQDTTQLNKLYNGTVELMFEPTKHLYTVNGEVVDGVTSVLGVINKPALIYWSANKAAEFIDLNLKVGQVIDELEKKKLVDGAKSAHRIFKTDAGDLGTMLHNLIEKFIKGLPHDEPTNEKLKLAFDQFRKWVVDNKVEFQHSERKVYSKEYGYAGTLDFVAKIDGKVVIGDIKTSSGIWDEYWLQTAAYKQALAEEGVSVDHTLIIRCGKDGSFEVQEMDEFEDNIKGFLGALALYRRIKIMAFNKKQKANEVN